MLPADPFDPQTLEGLGIVQDDDAYCVYHGREMEPVRPTLEHEGGLYIIGDRYTAYTCDACFTLIARLADLDPEGGPEVVLLDAFDKWDEGKLPSDMFQFAGEGTVEDGIVIVREYPQVGRHSTGGSR